MSRRGWCKKRMRDPAYEGLRPSLWANGRQTRTGLPLRGRANMSKHFITGAARSVTNSVERLTELRKNHPNGMTGRARRLSLANGC